MVRTINFVRERQRSLTKIEAQDALTLRWTTIGLGVIVALVFIAVGARLFFVYSLKSVTQTQQNIRQQIISHQEVEKSFTIFTYKLKTLSDLFGKRREKQEALEYFSSIFGPDVIVRQLQYSDTNQVLKFTMEAKNIFVMDHVFVVLNGDEIKKKYPSIQKEQLHRGSSGEYGIQLTITLADKPLEGAPKPGENKPGASAVPEVGAP